MDVSTFGAEMKLLIERAAPYRDALCISPFRKLLAGQSLSMAGDAICLAALPVALIRTGFGVEVFGFVMAAVGAGTVLGAFVGGVLADRRSPKRILIGTDIVRGAMQVAATLVIVAGTAWWWLVLVYLMFGVGIGVSRPCAQVLLVNLLPKEALVAGNGAMNFIDNLVAVILPVTVGVLIILWDPVWGILIDGITFFCAAIFTALLPDMEAHDADEQLTVRAVFKGLTVISHNPTLLLGFAATLVVNVLCFPVFLVVAPYAVSGRFGDAMWAVCLAASGGGACIGSVVTVLAEGHQRLKALAVLSGLILSGAMVLLGAGIAIWIVVLGVTLIGFVEASWLTGWATSMQTLSPEQDLGKVVAIDTFVTSGTYPFIYLGSGLVAGVVGYSETLIIVAIASAMGTAAIAFASVLHVSRGRRVSR